MIYQETDLDIHSFSSSLSLKYFLINDSDSDRKKYDCDSSITWHLCITPGLYSPSGKALTQILWSLEAARLDVIMILSL